MNQRYVLTRRESDVIRSVDTDGSYTLAQVASENRLTPSEAMQTLDDLQSKGLVTIDRGTAERTKINLTQEGEWVRQGLKQGSSLISRSGPQIYILDDEPSQSPSKSHLQEFTSSNGNIDKELDRVIKNLG